MRSPAAALALFASLSSAEAAPKVMASILPIHSIVAAVMGDTGSPELIFKGTVSEHGATLLPRQLVELGNANLVFMTSPSLEVRLGQIDRSEAVNGRSFVMLADTPGIAKLKIRQGGAWEAHDHEPEENQAPGEGIATYNGHIWLSPANARIMASEIARQLAAADPSNAAIYQANAAAFSAAVDQASSAIAARLAAVKDQPFIVFHDAYPYFEEAFGLSAVGSIADASGAAPSARRLGEIRARLADSGAVCVFREPQFSERFAEAVVEGTTARLGILDPVGASLSPGKGAYVQLLNNLAENLLACLAGKN